jgi:spermidine synthase
MGIAATSLRASSTAPQTTLISLLFFLSGMPALIYQIVWQRALFAIYGVNVESVAVVVSAFMLGLGLGSLIGGWLSARFPVLCLMFFGLAELGTAVFGVCSLHVFHWVAYYTAGTSLPYVVLLSVLLLTLPTMLMGATLPLLVEHLVRFSGRVGDSVATLYFVNTLGSSVACLLCATFLLRNFAQSGSVFTAACVNALVGSTAFVFARSKDMKLEKPSATVSGDERCGQSFLSLRAAMWIAGVSGFVALGLEVTWFRVISLVSSDRAPAFALLLAALLAGIAVGAFLAERLTKRLAPASIALVVGVLMMTAGAVSTFLPPLVGFLRTRIIYPQPSALAFFVVAALLGAVLPLLCQLSVAPDSEAGRGVSLVYFSDIVGSTLGGLVIGFIVMNHCGLRAVAVQLSLVAVLAGAAVTFYHDGRLRRPPGWAIALMVATFVAVCSATQLYSHLFDNLIRKDQSGRNFPFVHIVENRNGVIGVTANGAVYGNGVYDGYFNIDPMDDLNLILRAYAVSAFQAAPRTALEIGFSSGSWAQVLVNHPQLNSLDVVEINPGYLKLLPLYPAVSSLCKNPKLHIFIDDGRRWLLAHPEKQYDLIVYNSSFYWRDHSSHTLSLEFLKIVRQHLNPGGIYYYNTTGSDDVVATGLKVFPYGLRVANFLAVSDAPIDINKERWMSVLRQYRIDGRLVFDPALPNSESTLAKYLAFADSLHQPPTPFGMESSESLHERLRNRLIITDDNMGWEWRHR